MPRRGTERDGAVMGSAPRCADTRVQERIAEIEQSQRNADGQDQEEEQAGEDRIVPVDQPSQDGTASFLRAHDLQARLIQNPQLSVQASQVSAAYLYTLLRLPWLAPDITTAIVNGRKPPQLTAQTLMRLTPRLPVSGRSLTQPAAWTPGAAKIRSSAVR